MSRADRRHPDRSPLPTDVPKEIGGGRASFGNIAARKGMGPNKACGHKGGICRQGSKRG